MTASRPASHNAREVVVLYRRLAIAALALATAPGCSQDGLPLAPVEGVVTLNGSPLSGALVEFQPLAVDGSPSYGETNEQGRYEMMFSQDRAGAWTGQHRVRITTRNENERIAELLPPEYHAETTLVREVKVDTTNVFDFRIETEVAAADDDP